MDNPLASNEPKKEKEEKLSKDVNRVCTNQNNNESNESQLKSNENENWIKLNVGGKTFLTTRNTLTWDKNSMLAKMFSGDSFGQLFKSSTQDPSGAYLLDRDPKYFGPLLNYLRTRKLIIDRGINVDGVLEEAMYFQIESLVELLDPANRPDLTRLKLMRLDFSRLRLPQRIFDFSDISQADFSSSILVEASFLQVEGSHANFSGATAAKAVFRNSRFPFSSFRNCELSSANFSNSDLSSASFEKATCPFALFQRARMPRANFERADLANAKFQQADLCGSSFLKANLSNVRFKGANLCGSSIDWEKAIGEGALFRDATVTKEDWQKIPIPLEEKKSLGLVIKHSLCEVSINFDLSLEGESTET